MKRISIAISIIFFLLLSSCGVTSIHDRYSDMVRIKNDLTIITKTEKSRNYQNPETLNSVALYIFNELSKSCDTVYFQTYLVNGIEYKNVIGSIGRNRIEKIVIGAHYDVAGEQEGADDNASGVVGVLELARLLSKEPLKYQIEFVAYTLEEPPFFGGNEMGSYIHAKSIFDKGEKIKGMICLEMIGYFNDYPKSQDYPVGFLKLFYGDKGNYITVVQKFGNGAFGRQVKRLMKRQDLINTKSFKGPASLQGVDFSDHRNYWKFNYSAVMISNTAFYRNENYHENTDKLETLDLNRMGLVIDELYMTVKKIK